MLILEDLVDLVAVVEDLVVDQVQQHQVKEILAEPVDQGHGLVLVVVVVLVVLVLLVVLGNL
jgi:hypothetical protein